tara:strand:+ start:125 stop:322 length:198 start_codon:yes stop_codon:yes gene_type:complete
MSNIEKKLRKYTLSDLIEHLENLGYSNQEIDLFIELMVLEVKDWNRWKKLDKESKKFYNGISKEL